MFVLSCPCAGLFCCASVHPHLHMCEQTGCKHGVCSKRSHSPPSTCEHKTGYDACSGITRCGMRTSQVHLLVSEKRSAKNSVDLCCIFFSSLLINTCSFPPPLHMENSLTVTVSVSSKSPERLPCFRKRNTKSACSTLEPMPYSIHALSFLKPHLNVPTATA